jgi:hypothetical protein
MKRPAEKLRASANTVQSARVPKIDVHSAPAAKSQLPERAHGLYVTQRNARRRLNAPMQAMQKHSTQKIPQHAQGSTRGPPASRRGVLANQATTDFYTSTTHRAI